MARYVKYHYWLTPIITSQQLTDVAWALVGSNLRHEFWKGNGDGLFNSYFERRPSYEPYIDYGSLC